MNRVLVVAVVLASVAAHAQVVVPQAPSTSAASSSSPASALSGQVGVERFGPPVVTLTFAPASVPLSSSHAGLLLVGRLDTAGRSVSAGAGVQAVQVFADEWFVREAAVASPFVVAIDTVAGGLRAEATVQLGKRFGDVVDVVIGPRAIGVITVANSSDGRIGFEGAAAVRWRVADHVALTGELSAGTDVGHRASAVTGSVLSGAAFVGVQWSP